MARRGPGPERGCRIRVVDIARRSPGLFRPARRGGRGDRPRMAEADRRLDLRGQLGGLRKPLITQHRGEPVGIALPHGAHLPGALPAIQLDGDDGGLGAQTGEGVAGDPASVQAGDRDTGRGSRPEPAHAAAPGQGQQHTHAVHGLGQRVEIHREAVLGGGLTGDLDAGEPRRPRVGHGVGARQPALLVAERHPGHDGPARHHTDLHTGAVQRMVLPPDQLGRHRSFPLVVVRPGPATGADGPERGGGAARCALPLPAMAAETATDTARSPAPRPGRYGRWRAHRSRSSSSRRPRGAPST